MLVPRNKFGSSLYNVPLLLALRFFYHASPFEASAQSLSSGRNERDIARFTSQEVAASFVPVAFGHPHHHIQPGSDPFRIHEKLSTTDWLARISASPTTYAHHRLISLTWTKALGSPLSHEFIQFILEDTCTGRRSRHLTHRHVDGGDSVLLGFDWTSGKEPSQHHALPLPLLSLMFHDGPRVADFANALVEITNRKPEYSLLREMCWWHAEAVFEACHERYGGRIKEWDFAHLRYSFVVKTNVIKREKLVRHAEEFRALNTKELCY